MLRLWGRPSAFNVQKALWLLHELALDFEHINVGGDAGGLDSPEFLARNPHGRIPVIDDDGVVVWESNTVLRYLAATYGGESLWSDDPVKRARWEGWMDWGLADLQRDFLDLFWGFYRTPAPDRNPALVANRTERCKRHFELLNRWLAEREWLAGDRFSLAEIPSGTTLFRYFNIEVERPAVPHVERWYAQLQTRPAFQQAIMVPFSELFGKVDF
ncbi:MAG: glutathione S-transferase family protein [Pseudomonadota bacterium]